MKPKSKGKEEPLLVAFERTGGLKAEGYRNAGQQTSEMDQASLMPVDAALESGAHNAWDQSVFQGIAKADSPSPGDPNMSGTRIRVKRPSSKPKGSGQTDRPASVTDASARSKFN